MYLAKRQSFAVHGLEVGCFAFDPSPSCTHMRVPPPTTRAALRRPCQPPSVLRWRAPRSRPYIQEEALPSSAASAALDPTQEEGAEEPALSAHPKPHYVHEEALPSSASAALEATQEEGPRSQPSPAHPKPRCVQEEALPSSASASAALEATREEGAEEPAFSTALVSCWRRHISAYSPPSSTSWACVPISATCSMGAGG